MARTDKPNEALIDALWEKIDTHGIVEVIAHLAIICDRFAERQVELWQDTRDAQRWNKIAENLRTCGILKEPSMEEYQQRMIEERNQLHERAVKLSAFLGSGVYSALPKVDQMLLDVQYDYMKGYLRILDRRIERFHAKD